MDIKSLHGLILVDKPANFSSAKVTNYLKWMFHRRGIKSRDIPKIGHGGTLDPFATGLLVVLIGHGVRFATTHLGGDKTYEGVIRFGQKTHTGDGTSDVILEGGPIENFDELQKAASSFCSGVYQQIPPMHSAKKVDGRRLFKLARQGQVVERAPVACVIHKFTLQWINNFECAFEVTCSAGTFIRVLAEDLAQKINTVAHLKSLRRSMSGSKSVDQAWSLEQLDEHWRQGNCWSSSPAFFPLEDLITGWPSYQCDPITAQSIRYGRNDVLCVLGHVMAAEDSIVALMVGDKLLAIAEKNEQGMWKYKKVIEGR